MISCNIKFDGAKIEKGARKGGIAGLYKSAALLMHKARQKIRFRKRSISRPGSPPFQHSRGRNSFRHTIQFAIDKPNLTAYVGPQKISQAVGLNVPRTLEFGGMTGPAVNPSWYQVHGLPKNGLNSKSDIAQWLMLEGFGPLFMAGSESGVMNQVAASQGAKKYSRAKIAASRSANANHWMFRDLKKRKIPQDGRQAKTVFYYLLPIRTMRQATRAADNIVKHYGLPKLKPHYVAPRPFMAPTMRESQNQMAKFFANSIH